jgi:predicted  nucleic acid-binding Zn-ribbon protein
MAMGLPKIISGNFASVFPMTAGSGHRYAVKCFTREVPNQLQRYMLISEYLNKRKPWWATEFQFISDGIQVDSRRYPILRMNWVNGATLTRWITENINNTAALSGLAVGFDQLISDLTAANIAHGDLQDGNLLVANNGALHLVDYDGMFVPGLERLPPDELGHPNYQPPGRSQADYGPAMDRYSAWLIALSLRMLAADPKLWDQLNPLHDDYLLLTRSDLGNLGSSQRFAKLTSHPDVEVRRLARIARDILPLPLTAMPMLAVPSPTVTPTQAPRMAAASGIPGWMRSHVAEPAASPNQSGTRSQASQIQPQVNGAPGRSLTLFVRIIAMLTVAVAGTIVWSSPIGLAAVAAMVVLATTIVWKLYRRDSITREFTQLRKARARAASDVKQAAVEIARISKNIARAERATKRLDDQRVKQDSKIQATFEKRLRQVAHLQEAFDQRLTQLRNRKQEELKRRLMQLQREHVQSWLSRVTLGPNQVAGVGSQLVARLGLAGIRVAADFTGIAFSYPPGGAPAICFRLATGRLVHVPGVGEVKAQRLEQWRQSHVADAVRRQPSALPTSELRAIDAEFAAQERQISDERARVTKQIAAQSAAIKQELDAALATAADQQRPERMRLDQRRTGLMAELGQAHSSQLNAQQQLLDQDNHLAAVRRPTFSRFLGTVIRG